MREKPGGAEILRTDHLNMTNPFGHPVVSWVPTSQGYGGLHNPRGYAGLRIAVTKLIEGILRAIYDQIQIVENPGSIVIAQLGDRVCLIQNFRNVGERILPDATSDYVSRLQKEHLWDKLVKSMGRWCWESPRGLVPPSNTEINESLDDFVIRSAKLEALEEAGLVIEDARIVGRVNANPTFFFHSQYVVYARIASTTDATPEDLEMIGQNRLYSMQELRELNNTGEFEDGLTLAALALCGLHL